MRRRPMAFDPHELAHGDAIRLARLMRNLIDNTIKLTDHGWVVLSLALVEDDTLQVEVSDTGPGVPEDQRIVIFDKFHQLDRPCTSQKSGVGLGLSICREIVTLFGDAVLPRST